MGLTMIHDKKYFFLAKPSVIKTIHSRPAYDDAFENDPYHRKQKRIDEDEAGYQYGLIRESIRQIKEANHDKETHKD